MGQARQPDVPEAAANWPAAQLEQAVAPAAEYRPETQVPQVVARGLAWKLPTAQAAQVVPAASAE